VSTVELDDYRWLVSDAARPYLHEASDSDRSIVSLAKLLRRDLSVNRVHLVLEQVELRKRAAVKFSRANSMFFTRQLLEQSTGEQIAGYKARRFPSGGLIADLCCGIGGDLQALARRGEALAIDKDAISLLLAEKNCDEGVRNIRSQVCDVRDVAVTLKCSAWHIDPDRRATGVRTSTAEFSEPGIETLRQLAEREPSGAVKFAPAASVPGELANGMELEWISSRRECRQQVAWLGDLARRPGQHVATIVDRSGRAHTFAGEPNLTCPIGPMARYIFDFDPAVAASRLIGAIAVQHNLCAIGPVPSYLTSDTVINHKLLTCFEVNEVLPLDIKRLQSFLHTRHIGQLEIKVRGADISLPSLRRKFRLRGSRVATMLVYTNQGNVYAVLAERVN